MKIVKVRFSHCVLAFDEDRMPVKHRFHNEQQGLTIEIRHFDRQAFIYGQREVEGHTKHCGNNAGYWAHSDADLYYYIGAESFRIAEELGVEEHHIWPFLDQFPVFTNTGVNVADALELADQIKDLFARGAQPAEVMRGFNITKETIEFALGTQLPPQREVFAVAQDEDSEQSSW